MLRASREDGDRTAVSEYVRHLAGDEVGVEVEDDGADEGEGEVGGEHLPRVRGEHGDAVTRDDAEFVAEEPREGDDAGGERGVREDGRRRRGRVDAEVARVHDREGVERGRPGRREETREVRGRVEGVGDDRDGGCGGGPRAELGVIEERGARATTKVVGAHGERWDVRACARVASLERHETARVVASRPSTRPRRHERRAREHHATSRRPYRDAPSGDEGGASRGREGGTPEAAERARESQELRSWSSLGLKSSSSTNSGRARR